MEYWKSYESYVNSVWELEESVGVTLEELSNINQEPIRNGRQGLAPELELGNR
jgi:hypothetical protein